MDVFSTIGSKDWKGRLLKNLSSRLTAKNETTEVCVYSCMQKTHAKKRKQKKKSGKKSAMVMHWSVCVWMPREFRNSISNLTCACDTE